MDDLWSAINPLIEYEQGTTLGLEFADWRLDTVMPGRGTESLGCHVVSNRIETP